MSFLALVMKSQFLRYDSDEHFRSLLLMWLILYHGAFRILTSFCRLAIELEGALGPIEVWMAEL